MWETKPGTTRPTISWLVMDQKRSRDLKLMIMMIIYNWNNNYHTVDNNSHTIYVHWHAKTYNIKAIKSMSYSIFKYEI